jgi:hypothetical protein
MMRKRLGPEKSKKQVRSILLVGIIVAASMVVVFPLTVPKVKAQIVHLASAFDEDGTFPYDTDGLRNNIVVWDAGADHHIYQNYSVGFGYTLEIPALNYMFDPDLSNEITFKTADTMIEVWGTLTTSSDGNPLTKTLFWAENLVEWKGIFFRPGSYGNITDCIFMDADRALVLLTMTIPYNPMTLIYPGITNSTFTGMDRYGILISGVIGYTNIEYCNFEDTSDSAIGLRIEMAEFDVKKCSFYSHGDNESALNIRNSKVNVMDCYFQGNFQPGNLIDIDDTYFLGFNFDSNETVVKGCKFKEGASGDHLIRVDCCTPFFNNCSFDTSNGELSLEANELIGIPAHPIIRNPTADGTPGFWDDTFDNTTINATGGSSVTLQWYMDVYVIDPDGNPIDNALVWVEDRNGDPAEPHSKSTDGTGWARWFTTTELIQYANSVTHFSPFDVSALNNSMMGYANPKPMMDMSKEINVIVPFNPIPNIPPIVSSIAVIPPGVQSGNITIQYQLEDPNEGDNGNLSVIALYSMDGLNWRTATQGSGGNSTTELLNNTVYTFVWDSKAPMNLPDIYNTTVYIMILPYDRAGPGTPSQTGNFTVDNVAPILLSGPFITLINDTAIIEWTVHEPADANVLYGLTPNFPNQQSGSTGSTSQNVTLTGLQPGRNYTYIIESTDLVGNKFSSSYTFKTEIHIQLYKGWNMISIPPKIGSDLITVLSPIAGQYDAVQAYDINDTNDPWKHYKVGKPWGNDLSIMHSGRGLWIHMKNDAVFTPNHKDPTTNPMFPGYTPVGFEPGWNFVGYPSLTTLAIDIALTGVPYDIVQTYDAFTHQWLSYDPSGYSTDTLTQMEMGKGYWIHCTASHLWQVDYV